MSTSAIERALYYNELWKQAALLMPNKYTGKLVRGAKKSKGLKALLKSHGIQLAGAGLAGLGLGAAGGSALSKKGSLEMLKEAELEELKKEAYWAAVDEKLAQNMMVKQAMIQDALIKEARRASLINRALKGAKGLGKGYLRALNPMTSINAVRHADLKGLGKGYLRSLNPMTSINAARHADIKGLGKGYLRSLNPATSVRRAGKKLFGKKRSGLSALLYRAGINI